MKKKFPFRVLCVLVTLICMVGFAQARSLDVTTFTGKAVQSTSQNFTSDNSRTEVTPSFRAVSRIGVSDFVSAAFTGSAMFNPRITGKYGQTTLSSATNLVQTGKTHRFLYQHAFSPGEPA